MAFANTEEPLHEKILGRDAFERGRPGRFDRRTNTGSRVAVTGDYAGALHPDQDQQVEPVVHEVFGGWGWRAVRLFRLLARTHADTLDPSLSSWAARTLTAYHSQRISIAIHTRSADEIHRNIQCERSGSRSSGSRRRSDARAQPGTRRT